MEFKGELRMPMEKGDNFLPVGSVVILKGGYKKVMITGYCIKTTTPYETKKDKT